MTDSVAHIAPETSVLGTAGIGMSVEDAAQHAAEIVKRSGTSFAAGMRILSRERREAMYAIYAFAREVDDVADEGGTYDERMIGLAAWRDEIARCYESTPQTPVGVALVPAIRRFDLDRHEFEMLIEGMVMDVEGPLVAPSHDRLMAYCRRVAGAVGLLSMPVFGAGRGDVEDRFAIALANALQLTNILRDVEEDAEMGRVYLPSELLDECGISTRDPHEIAGHEAVQDVARRLGREARGWFGETQALLTHLNWREVRPALLMMGVYERYLRVMEERDFAMGDPVKLGKAAKLGIALRYLLLPPRRGAVKGS
ncbi:presqualene diphosphate synthase HpnD [Pyruvatibacter sp. HU-CL02332]|uniref:presqualene diphosphate synthase HpnD n=1 Tax=Pyruvatibacter sp. HU-CL02332 TaxID=3127650 RepID=UPI003103A99D